MLRKTVSGTMLTLLLIGIFVIFPIDLVKATSTVHFICSTMNRGNGGSITFAGTTYQHGQSASYSESDYWITGNPPSPTTDWFFYQWRVLYIGSQSWVDNQYAQSTWFHLRGEAYLEADFYSPIQANSPTYSTVYYGEKNRVTGSAKQYYSQQLSVCYYPHGSGYGPSNPNGLPPFGCPGGAGYGWTTVTVSPSYPGTWDTGLITPTIPLFSPSYTLPMTVDVFAGWAIGSVNEVDSNVASFVINKAPVLIAAPTLTPSAISLGESVSITDQIFSRYFINSGDMTGTWTIQEKLEGAPTWTDITSGSFTSVYGYSSVYGEYGVFYEISSSWTPPAAGTYRIRISYTGNRFYESRTSLESLLTVGGAVDLGIVSQIQHKDTKMLCLEGCDLDGSHAWDNVHDSVGCDHDNQYCVRACASMIASYFGGHLSQDRISYYYMHDIRLQTEPEHDLGHNYPVQTLDEVRSILAWTLNIQPVGITYRNEKPTFTDIKAWIDAGRPIVRRFEPGPGQGHVTIIDGYEDAGEILHVIDPGSGVEERLSYQTLPITQVWVPPEGATARSDEPTVGLDSDDDGVVDFDEINRFHTDPDNPDTDGDLIFDKEEIICYTFLSDGSFDSWNLRWPDVDFDDLRCELDTDSDGGGTTDGLEDSNRNGRVDVGETDPLNFIDDLLRAAKIMILGYSPINLLVTDPDNRRVGYDPDTQSVLNEVPGATYSGPGSEPQEITIPNSLNGTYKIDAIGTDTGPYTITVESLDSNSSIIDSDTWQGMAELGERYSEIVSLESDGRLILPHDLEVTSLSTSKTIVGQGYTINMTITIENQGNYSENFNVTFYANTTVIATITDITLTSGNSTTITFTWNTTGFAKGNYTIWAYAWPVLGEIHMADNTLTDGWIIVSMVGDITGPNGWPDGKCDMRDIRAVAKLFGINYPDPKYNPNCDINDDLKIDMKDIRAVAKQFGKTDP